MHEGGYFVLGRKLLTEMSLPFLTTAKCPSRKGGMENRSSATLLKLWKRV